MSNRPTWLARANFALTVARLLQLPAKPPRSCAERLVAGVLPPPGEDHVAAQAYDLWRDSGWQRAYLGTTQAGAVRLLIGTHTVACRQVTSCGELLRCSNELHRVATGRELGEATRSGFHVIPDRRRVGDARRVPRGGRRHDDPPA